MTKEIIINISLRVYSYTIKWLFYTNRNTGFIVLRKQDLYVLIYLFLYTTFSASTEDRFYN